MIGNHAGDGISNDERKRVTMGVEMAADPAILFLDEVRWLPLPCKCCIPHPSQQHSSLNIPRIVSSRRRVWTRLAPSA